MQASVLQIDQQRRPNNWVAWVLSAILVVVLLCSLLVPKLEPGPAGTQAVIIFGAIGVFVATLLVLSNERFGLNVFLVCACLSPRYADNFRLEDLLIPVLVFAWFWRSINGRRTIVWTLVTVPIILVTVTMILSWFWGLCIDGIPKPSHGLLMLGKRVEYFFLFFLALNTVRTKQAARSLMTVFLLGAVAASFVGMTGAWHDSEIGTTRAAGMDEDNYNTFAGFLVIAISMAITGVFQYREPRMRLIFSVVSLILMAALMKSYSREGYFMLAIVVIVLGILRYRALLPAIAIFILAAPFVLPDSVTGRATNAVTTLQNASTDSVNQNSFSVRLAAWDWRWNGWVVKQPVFGSGVGSIPLTVDNEYLLRLVESGAIGLGAFLLLMFSCGRYILACASRLGGTEVEPFAYGLLAAFVGLLVQGCVAAAWSTIRTMEPFWILMGSLGGLVVYGGYAAEVRDAALKRPIRRVRRAMGSESA